MAVLIYALLRVHKYVPVLYELGGSHCKHFNHGVVSLRDLPYENSSTRPCIRVQGKMHGAVCSINWVVTTVLTVTSIFLTAVYQK